MMATLWLENVAHEAVTASFVLWVTEMEAPEDRYLAWICCHALNEGPDKQDEEHVEDGEHKDDSPVVCYQRKR